MELVLPNVSQVPIYSPLRYPGGKSRWFPFVKRWLQHANPDVLVEPFAGGAHMGLAAGLEGWTEVVYLAEKDDYVRSFWSVVLSPQGYQMAREVRNIRTMTPELVNYFLKHKDEGSYMQAMALLIHNRASRGGILAEGSGLMNEGENGNGLDSRWYPDSLADRIEKITDCFRRFTMWADGERLIENTSSRSNFAFFLDPPYNETGGRLYEHGHFNPRRLFELAHNLKGDFLITYSDNDEVRYVASGYGMEVAELAVSSTHHTKNKELLIGRDLSWLK